MSRIRVLIVDSSSITRETLRQLLGSDRDLEVVAVTASGIVALSKVNDLNPDVVLLDVAKPDMEGLKTLAVLRETHPTLPVIMFSRLTERGSQTTVDALLLGATAYVMKPESKADLERCVRGELATQIKASGARAPTVRATAHSVQDDVPAELRGALTSSPVAVPTPRNSSPPAEIVVIATSTGGPNALASLLSALPASFATPIVVVQHIVSGFASILAESLRRQTGHVVREGDSVQPLNAAMVWIAPDGRHLVVTRQGVTTQVAPNDDPPENDCRPSADVLFRSVVSIFGSRCLAVVLTGMGNDGLEGCRAIRQAGGTILVQDEASSICWGMPGQVATAGLADLVLPLTDLPQEICRRTSLTHVRTVDRFRRNR